MLFILNKKHNTGRINYFGKVITFSLIITVGMYVDWIYTVPSLFAFIVHSYNSFKTVIELFDSELIIQKQYVLFQRTWKIPLYKLRDYKLLNNQKNTLDLVYVLNNEKSKSIRLTNTATKETETIKQFQDALFQNETLSLKLHASKNN